MLRLILALGTVFLVGLVGCGGQTLTLATTTSAYDSGLLGVLLPPFEKAHRVKVKVVAVGTGQALALGQKGDADVLLVHSPQQEEEFMAQGYGAVRRRVMANDFVLLGPPQDPAGVRGRRDAVLALEQIARAGALFVSRGDGSGTHLREEELWALAGVSPKGQPWYLSAGQGMGETLTLAHEKGAYTLGDRGTYLTRQKGLELIIMVEGEARLLNPYSAIAVNPKGRPQARSRLAQQLVDYLTSPPAQRLIADFGRDRFGQPLFQPVSEGTR